MRRLQVLRPGFFQETRSFTTRTTYVLVVLALATGIFLGRWSTRSPQPFDRVQISYDPDLKQEVATVQIRERRPESRIEDDLRQQQIVLRHKEGAQVLPMSVERRSFPWIWGTRSVPIARYELFNKKGEPKAYYVRRFARVKRDPRVVRSK